MPDQLERFERQQIEAEQAYERMIEGKCCGDCGECAISPDEKTDWHWCRVQDDYVNAGDLVTDINCGTFSDGS